MKKITIACFLALSFAAGASAQPHLLVIQGEPGKFYVEHVVDAKENWYSVGRMYNISPRDIAPFNGTTLSTPLEVGQRLKIPLTASNFSQDGQKGQGETLVPIYHTIQPKEWLYHISTTYSKVPVATLEKWNHITGDQAKAGMDLIVAYLKVKSTQSSLADAAIAQAAPASANQPANRKDSLKAAPVPAKDMAVKEPAKEVQQISKQSSPPNAKENKSSETAAVAKSHENVQPAGQAANNLGNATQGTATHGGVGFFGTEYVADSKTLSGQAGTFKSTSGWQDGKYYALMNNVPVGTIVKVTSPATNKTVYAKVLGQLPDMKESMGLVIRVSNAAAAEMGAGEGKFNVDLRY